MQDERIVDFSAAPIKCESMLVHGQWIVPSKTAPGAWLLPPQSPSVQLPHNLAEVFFILDQTQLDEGVRRDTYVRVERRAPCIVMALAGGWWLQMQM